MACEVANSPFSEHGYDEAWSAGGNADGLDAIIDFNNSFNDASHASNGAVDPNTLSNPPSPASDFANPFGGDADDNQAPAPAYPSDLTEAPQTPYFQSIEQQKGSLPASTSATLRHEFRRSVSEPPGGLPIHHRHVQGQPQVTTTFHRNGHFLGHSVPSAGIQKLKSLPKNKPAHHSRNHSYNKQHCTRQSVRRCNTQPGRPMQAPTSMPAPQAMMMPHPQPHPFPPAMGMSHPMLMAFEPMPGLPENAPHTPRYLSSRVCTPAGSPQQVIDPMLTAPSPPTPGNVGLGIGLVGGQAQAAAGVTVPLTVEELKTIIQEAVNQAVVNLDGAARSGTAGASETLVAEDLGEEVLTAAVESGEGSAEMGAQESEAKE